MHRGWMYKQTHFSNHPLKDGSRAETSPFTIFSKCKLNQYANPQFGTCKTDISMSENNSEISECEYLPIIKLADPSVAMLVRNKEGKQRSMRIEERCLLYLRQWCTTLKRHKRTLQIGNLYTQPSADFWGTPAWSGTKYPDCCHICQEPISENTLLVNPHVDFVLYKLSEGNIYSRLKETNYSTECVLCIQCLLTHSFKCRGMAQQPKCPFCNVEFEEKHLVPFSIENPPKPV